ncbi:CPK2, partial [Symbiodinium sp. CCMP2456]
MISSRCCAPCCCQDTMPNVPAPCPVGPLNQAINPKILDYPFMIGIGGEVVTTAPVVLLPFFFRSFRDNEGGSNNVMVLQLTRVLWVGLTALGAFCAF